MPGLNITDQECADAMTMSGIRVKGFKRLDKNLEKIVVGRILSAERHPDADRLMICQTDIGTDRIQIVTGALHIKVGDKVPVVLDGGRIPGGHDSSSVSEHGIPIKKGRLRGVESNGMICSLKELGSAWDRYTNDPEEAICVMDPDVPEGADAVELLGLRDTIFTCEIPYNRADCCGVLGVARQLAAVFNMEFCPPHPQEKGNDEKVSDYIQLDVQDSTLCLRYCARVVKNIRIAPSPEWMRRRLAACGIRPVNNLVDIVNYAAQEYGQPIHIYDMGSIVGHKIIVRRARDGEQFQTLDGQIRNLDHSTLMICDAEKEIGIAGIMGGEHSRGMHNASAIMLEAACFDGANIRRSAKRLGIQTEMSEKFGKSLDPNIAQEAINRACQLIDDLGCGDVVGGMADFYPNPRLPGRISFDWKRINRLLGTSIPEQDMLDIFRKLTLDYDSKTKEVIVPTFRQDLECGADLAEEVARFFGYCNIPATLPKGICTARQLSPKLRTESAARNAAEYSGFSQAMTYPFESPAVFEKLMLPADSPMRRAVAIMNPLSEDCSVMRTSLINGMLASLSANYNQGSKNIRLYELANIYLPDALPLTELPKERTQLMLGFCGDGDFFTMKGVAEEFLYQAGLQEKVIYDPDHPRSFLHPGRQADMIYNGRVIGWLGEVHPDVADRYGIGARAYLANLDMPCITELAVVDRKYTEFARYPAVTRDISMVAKKEIRAGEIEKVIEEQGGELLENCQLFDVYEGTQIPRGYKSMAYSVTFRAEDRTLEEQEVSRIMEKILSGLKKLGIELRV